MKLNSIRFKTSVLYTVILGVILVAYSGVLYFAVRTILYRDIDESLTIKAKEVGDIIRAYEQVRQIDNRPISVLSNIFKDETMISNKVIVDELWHSGVRTLNLKSDFIHILTPKGRLILISENVKEDIDTLFNAQMPYSATQTFFQNIIDKNYRLRAINLPLVYNNRTWLVIQIGTPLAPVLHTLHSLVIFIVTAVSFVLLLTSFLGSLFARSVLKPVEEITLKADYISHKNLHMRIDGKQSDEEIKQLIRSFNTMLERLEASFGHVNEFSSHVAHELKTPLAILRGEMELALSEDHTPDEYRKVLEAGMQEVNRLIRIIKDLLLLANLDYRSDIFKFERIDFVSFIREIGENGKILASEKQIEMTCDIPEQKASVDGDQVHLRRVFFNLIGNAVKFTPAGGTIRLSLRTEGNKVAVAIEDTGIGIAPDDLTKIFTKFFRANNDAGPESSSGLGLNIAQAIVKSHQGEITVESSLNKGSVFTVNLPLADFP